MAASASCESAETCAPGPDCTGVSRPPPGAYSTSSIDESVAPARRSRSGAWRAAAAVRAGDRTCAGSATSGATRRGRLSTNRGRTAAASSSTGIRPMYWPFIQSSFSVLKTALPPLIPSSEKASISSAFDSNSRSSPGDQPSRARKVDHRVRQIALSLVLHHRRRAVPLAQPLLVGAQDQRHVREPRDGRAERLEEQHVLRRVGDVVVAADHVRDRHVHVVHDHRQVVGRDARPTGG